MKIKNLLLCIFLSLFQLIEAQTFELHNSINFGNVNDGRDLADGITWFKPTPLSYGIYRTSGSWLTPNYQQLKLAFDTGIIIDGGHLYGRSGIVLQPNGGNVGIGTANPTSKLTVAGNINAREVKVTVDAGADFVFENNYNLPSLESVDQFIKENKHLPEIASAEEMKKDGINLSEMNIKLLQKIEEMTLYMIEMQKEITKQKEEIKLLKAK